MKLRFVTNARFTQGQDGHIYGCHTSINAKTFDHYLKDFTEVEVIARLERSDQTSFSSDIRLDTERIRLLSLPHFIGPWQFLRQRQKIKQLMVTYLQGEGVTICRIPGSLGRLAANLLFRTKRPFGIEVAGDPYELFAPESHPHLFRPLLRILGVSQLRRLAKRATAALYVTKDKLQQRYPVQAGAYFTHASNVILVKEAFANKARRLERKKNYRLISIGTLDQMYKSPDIVLEAMRIINQADEPISVSLDWLGEGKHRKELTVLAEELGLSETVKFWGMVKPLSKVMQMVDAADIFVLPSRTEGLPRAMIEAMARAIPCIGTAVGGIPELLDKNELIPVNNAQALAEQIISICTDEFRYQKLSRQNLDRAQAYSSEKLNARRSEFYQYLIAKEKS